MTIPSRFCVVYYPDGEDISVVSVGWHRIDGPIFGTGDDGQDYLRQQEAVKQADLPVRIPTTIVFMDVMMPQPPMLSADFSLPD